jgi:FADH2 O2-dependent halogenase
LERRKNGRDVREELQQYDKTVRQELAFVDRLVAGGYDAMCDFPIFATQCMLYFAAATCFERARHEGRSIGDGAFLCADHPQLREIVERVTNRLYEQLGKRTSREQADAEFQQYVARAIEPFNVAGLCRPDVQNMYRYTAAPV